MVYCHHFVYYNRVVFFKLKLMCHQRNQNVIYFSTFCFHVQCSKTWVVGHLQTLTNNCIVPTICWGRFHQQAYTKEFTIADPKSVRRQSSHQCFFALLRSVGAKAAWKKLAKLTTKSQIARIKENLLQI